MSNLKLTYNGRVVAFPGWNGYLQFEQQANPPISHRRTFTDCGSFTTNGTAELAQIPSDWKS